MRKLPRFQSSSRVVHEEEQHELEEKPAYLGESQLSLSTSLTVWRKSLVFSCQGFTVIDSHGNLVYRVDNYIEHPQEVILMDASGKSLLTMRHRKKLGLLDSWFVYEGEVGNNRKKKKPSKSPICCVKKHVNILQSNSNVQAYVYRAASDKRCVFSIEGSYAHRMCKVLDESKRVVAEIKRKESNTKNVSFGIEIFQLIVQPGFDPSFAMALVLLLDQMFS